MKIVTEKYYLEHNFEMLNRFTNSIVYRFWNEDIKYLFQHCTVLIIHFRSQNMWRNLLSLSMKISVDHSSKKYFCV